METIPQSPEKASPLICKKCGAEVPPGKLACDCFRADADQEIKQRRRHRQGHTPMTPIPKDGAEREGTPTVSRSFSIPSLPSKANPAIIAFCVQFHLSKPYKESWASYDGVGNLPDDYGDYAVYDGLDLIAFGTTRSVAKAFSEYQHRLNSASIPIFIWRVDLDGSSRHWLEDDHFNQSSGRVCDRCEGTGYISDSGDSEE